mmetsp:Transcript_257/g.350  ORF Transcript_257/g.350 Transcript_257/m.350 type:complete len:195 (+) Transcript_257:197-781(+)|eukprot:CAMPEP_0198138810 /NCGR_PEP_ID=MMETSP1443-20131203/2202_1 /TAXON_ID=186043 /ORGANISM="Entomoneis sp., Strain CCMP2396" /LENGTH=194 /DNA_ID=CAMNT_0043800749 /DNA_START=120 /DNA_END=707 /DNA_ORIENTATION=-
MTTTTMISLFLLLVVVLFEQQPASAFTPAPSPTTTTMLRFQRNKNWNNQKTVNDHPITTTTARRLSSSNDNLNINNIKKSKSISFAQMKGESSSAYMKRLSQIASDPKAIEQHAKQQDNNELSESESGVVVDDSESAANGDTTVKRGYVRAEEWDKQENERIKSSMRGDERLQFDGQRFGNGFQQNEILRKNLY